MEYELKHQKRCKICKRRLFEYNDIRLKGISKSQCKVVDHIIPIAYGGDNKKSNLQVICFGCNTKKMQKDLFLYKKSDLPELEMVTFINN